MSLDDTIYYPQDEINTALLPVTKGCSYNKCAFCSMYKGQQYEEIPLSEILFQLQNMEPYTERIYLVGADPLHIGFKKMRRILKEIRTALPYCACVSAYSAVKTLKQYSEEELSILHDEGLRLLYIGFESGSDDILFLINKGHTAADAILQGKKLQHARLSYNAIIMYGVAGQNKGTDHMLKTITLLNQLQPYKIITMNLTLFPGTVLYQRSENGTYLPESNEERINELKLLIANLHCKKPVQIDTTHPTNLKKIRGVLPQDKEKLLFALN